MIKSSKLGLFTSVCGIVTFGLLLPVAEADAQRRGGGGRAASMSRPSGGSFNRSSMSGASSRQVRSSASSSLNYNGNRSGNRANVNTGNRNTNISGNNINTGDINVDRDVHVDGGYGCCYGDWDYHPVARAAVATATVATAWRLGAYYSTLPSSCVIVYRSTISYYQCGTYWYQPVYSGMTVQYVAVATPK